MCLCMASLLRLTSLFLQMFVPVFDSDGRWFVFCYNQRHNQFEFLSCDDSIDSWNLGDKYCLKIYSKLHGTLGHFLACNRKQAHVDWKVGSDVGSDVGLLALNFMEHYNGEPNPNMSSVTQNYKASILQYILYHTLNRVTLPKEFPRPIVRPFLNHSSFCQYLYLCTSVLPLVHSCRLLWL